MDTVRKNKDKEMTEINEKEKLKCADEYKQRVK